MSVSTNVAPQSHGHSEDTVPKQYTNIDLTPMIENLIIVDKDGRTIRFGDVMLPPQRKVIEKVNYALNHRLPFRCIILKARQIGISTVIEAIIFVLSMMIRRMSGLVISHDLDSSEHLLGMTQNYYDNFWLKDAYNQKNKSAKHLSWVESASSIRITTAKNATAGRSKTIRALHGSEVAFWDNAKTLMTGLAQTVPNRPFTFIFMESTANGVGNYFNAQWNKACSGKNSYIPMFFPWWTHPEYTASYLKLPHITGALDEEEIKLTKLLMRPPKAEWNDYQQESLTKLEIVDRLTWRRYAIEELCQGDLDKFKQEYPSTPEEAFIATGTNIFSPESLNIAYEPMLGIRGEAARGRGDKIEFVASNNGRLTLYKLPNPQQAYCIAADPTHSLNGDYAVAHILNRRTWEQVGIFRAKIEGKEFGEELAKLGKYYNWAIIAPEHLGGGIAAITSLQHLNYPNIWIHSKGEKVQGQMDNWYGWQMNHKTKAEAVSNLKYALNNRLTKFHDEQTFNEMVNFISLGDGKFGNSNEEEHDDCVTSYAIGVTVILYEQDELLTGEDMEPSTFNPVKNRQIKAVPNKETPQDQIDKIVMGGPVVEDEDIEPPVIWEEWQSVVDEEGVLDGI